MWVRMYMQRAWRARIRQPAYTACTCPPTCSVYRHYKFIPLVGVIFMCRSVLHAGTTVFKPPVADNMYNRSGSSCSVCSSSCSVLQAALCAAQSVCQVSMESSIIARVIFMLQSVSAHCVSVMMVSSSLPSLCRMKGLMRGDEQ